MLSVLLAVLSGHTVFVHDVSAPDAVYEDESRALAEEVVAVFEEKGFTAHRVDESELPRAGCREGPCLERVARGSDVIVTLDVVEEGKGRWGVAVTALASRNGMPLAGGRYHVTAKGKRPPKELLKFADKVVDAFKPRPPKDGGTSAPSR